MTDNDLHTFASSALSSIGETKLLKKFTISWNARMRSTAGRAMLQTYTIEMNPKLLAFGKKEVETTILHELAHLIAWKRHHHRGHGPAWKAACADLGIPGEKATHQLPLPTRTQKRRWRYRCKSCGKEFDRVRRARANSACSICCKSFNKGQYTSRFALEEFQLVD